MSLSYDRRNLLKVQFFFLFFEVKKLFRQKLLNFSLKFEIFHFSENKIFFLKFSIRI